MLALKTAFAALAAALGVHAAADTAKMELGGTVASNCTIAVVPTAKASSLDIVNGERDTLVGVVTESCNSGNGYAVSLTFNNRGQLRSDASGARPTSYEARYDDAQGVTARELVAQRRQIFFGREGHLTVNFAGDPTAVAGSYSDVVNLVIQAK